MTRAQRIYAVALFDKGWCLHLTDWPRIQRNKAMWTLVQMGLAEFGFGPRGDWLRTYCFMPVWSDPVV